MIEVLTIVQHIKMIKFTKYKTKRNHDNKTHFFFVNVPEAKQKGIGFQIRIKEYVYGISVINEK